MSHPTETPLRLSIIAPMNNEELCARGFCTRMNRVLKTMDDSYELIVVNDGSTDGTESILRELCTEMPELSVISLARRSGQWAALYAGFQYSRGELVVVMDSDLQHLPEEVPRLVEKTRDGYDLVSGSRAARTESLLRRRLPSLIANFLLRLTTGCRIRDMGGFKCLRGDIARQLRLRAGQHRLLPALVHMAGGRVGEVTVSAPPRFAGKTHYGLARGLDVVFDILMLWFQTAFKARPLYLFGHLSFCLMCVTGLIWAWLLYEKLALGVPMGTRPPFLVSVILFLAALGFASMGFIMEMLSGMLGGAKPYIVREVIGPKDTPQRREGS